MSGDSRPPVTDWATDFDIFDPDYGRDPAPIWRELRGRCPFPHTGRQGGMWMSTTYADARELAQMTSTLSNRQVSVAPLRPDSDPLSDRHSYDNPPITNDPPEHTPLRRVILPFFSPKAVETHRPYTEALCHRLIDGFVDAGGCDAAADYAQQITPRVIAHMLGIDTDRSPEFVTWVRGFIELGAADIELRAESLRRMREFFFQIVSERRRDPRDDYVSRLTEAAIDGEPFSDKMVVSYCVLLLVAGIDTTWSSIGSSLLHFATHPEDRRRMAASPDLFPTAVEELLRYYSPVAVGRIAIEDVEFEGHTIERGERVVINYPAANRDPEAFERADECLLDRGRNRHLAFGVGVHRCAGSNLARMEMDVALRTWFERIPEFELADPAKVSWSKGQIRGARCVPVVFGAAP